MNIVVHVGQPKTGSSSIQRFLHHNRNILESMGYYYHIFEENDQTDQKDGLQWGSLADPYSHSNLILKLAKDRSIVKTYIEKLKANAIVKKSHTIILSSELLSSFLSQEQIKNFLEILDSSVTAITYIKRPDLYIESMWQQRYFLNYDSFDEYLDQHPLPDLYDKVLYWKGNVQQFIITPFEKRYFKEGLEKHFLQCINIKDHTLFDFDYLSQEDDWGQNKGLTPEALNFVMLNKDLIKLYNDRDLLHRFINRNLETLFEKQHGENYNFLTYEQRLNILNHYEPILKKIKNEFFTLNTELFEIPKPYEGSASEHIEPKTVIRALMHIGVKQNFAIQELHKKVQSLEKNLAKLELLFTKT